MPSLHTIPETKRLLDSVLLRSIQGRIVTARVTAFSPHMEQATYKA